MKQQSGISSRVCAIVGNASRNSISSARKPWLVLGVATVALLTIAAGDTGVRPSLWLEQNATRYKTLGHQMICVCGCANILLECKHERFVPCDKAFQMRGELMAALQKGDSEEMIRDSFVQKYGAAVLTSPRDFTTLALIAWITGFAVLAVTGSALIVFVRKRHRPAIVTPVPLSDLDGIEADMLRRRIRSATENDDWW